MFARMDRSARAMRRLRRRAGRPGPLTGVRRLGAGRLLNVEPGTIAHGFEPARGDVRPAGWVDDDQDGDGPESRDRVVREVGPRRPAGSTSLLPPRPVRDEPS